jgi:uncharacterized protein YkwD
MATSRFARRCTLAALIAALCALGMPALGTGAYSHRKSGCARPSNFHTGKLPHNNRRVRCRRGHARKRHPHRRRHGHVRHHGHALAPGAHGACAGAQLRPTPSNIALVQAATLCLVNRERSSRGEVALRLDPRMQQAAEGHSASMAANDYFDHVGPGGTPLSRLRRAGYISPRAGYEIGENIGWGTLWLATPRAIVAAWMGSPGHRANILDPNFRDTAVGIAPDAPRSLSNGQAGAIYTQDFGVIG